MFWLPACLLPVLAGRNSHFGSICSGRISPCVCQYEKESYEIQIEDVKLFPQGYSALALHPEFITGEPSVLLIDIGGWTVDLMRLDNGVPNAATCRSLELGGIRCIDEIMEQVRRSTGLSVTGVQIERVLGGNACTLAPAAKEIILRHGRLYTEQILSAIMEAGCSGWTEEPVSGAGDPESTGRGVSGEAHPKDCSGRAK